MTLIEHANNSWVAILESISKAGERAFRLEASTGFTISACRPYDKSQYSREFHEAWLDGYNSAAKQYVVETQLESQNPKSSLYRALNGISAVNSARADNWNADCAVTGVNSYKPFTKRAIAVIEHALGYGDACDYPHVSQNTY